jgi:adenosine deaminase
MTKEQIVQLAKNSFEISWISEEEKNNYLTMIDEYVANN